MHDVERWRDGEPSGEAVVERDGEEREIAFFFAISCQRPKRRHESRLVTRFGRDIGAYYYLGTSLGAYVVEVLRARALLVR